MKRTLYLLASLALLAATAAVASPVSATPAAPSAPGQALTPYSGGGTANLAEVHAAAPVSGVADVVLSPVSTDVDSEGDPRSNAYASNLGGTDLLDAIDLNILSEVEQSAPADNPAPTEETTIPVDILPLLNLDVSTSSAWARWAGDGVCVAAGEPIAESSSTTAGADLLAVGDLPLVSLVNEQGGVSGTSSTVFTTGGEVRSLTSETATQVDEISLLQGTPLELHVSVADQPTLTATADGTPGGASVEYNEPLISIKAGPDGVLVPLEDLGTALNDVLFTVLRDVVGEALVPTLNTLLEALGDPVVVEYGVGADTLDETVADDGTSASAEVSLLRLHVSVLPQLQGLLDNPLLEAVAGPLSELGLTDINLDVDLGRMTANVAVPEGGISCPEPPTDNPLRDLHKDVSQADVAPGGQFDYTLTIPNRGDCTLTDVVVRDQIVSPEGTTVTGDPAFDSQDGDVYTWNIGEIAPNETVTITVTVDVPENAPVGFTFQDILTAEGDCDGTPVDRTVELDQPTITDEFSGPCDLQQSNKSSSHLEVMPGQTFQYFIHVFNQGAESCSDIAVFDVLDEQVDFVACTDGCTQEGQAVSWTGLSVPGGSGTTLTITVQAADDATGTLSNTAGIESPDDAGGRVSVTHNGPDVTDQSVPAPPNPPGRSDDGGTLPVTGGTTPALIALMLAVLGGLVWSLRRSSTA